MTIDKVIINKRISAIDSIYRHYKEHYLPEVVLVPTARLGLYVIGKLFFSHGDRIIVSPITCRTVIYALLSSGLVPVFVDIDLVSGNIDTTKISKALLKEAKGIITTNLYGNPDNALEIKKMAEKYDLFMIEDCAHVLHSSIDGQEIGTIGDVSIFSFKKFFDEPGGIVCTRDRKMSERIRSAVIKESFQPSRKKEILRFANYSVSKGILGPIKNVMFSWVQKMRHKISKQEGDPSGAARLVFSDSTEGLRASNPLYQQFPTTDSLLRTEKMIVNMNSLVAKRIRDNRDLINTCPLQAKISPFADEVCHFLVPFFAKNRDDIIMKMKEKGIMTWFLYNPPMNKLFTEQIVNFFPIDLDLIEEWSKRILPIDSKYKDEYLEVIRSVETPAKNMRHNMAC